MERRSGPLLCGQPLLGGQCFLLAGHDGPHNPGARASDAPVVSKIPGPHVTTDYSIAPAHLDEHIRAEHVYSGLNTDPSAVLRARGTNEKEWRALYQGSWDTEGAENSFHRAGVEKLPPLKMRNGSTIEFYDEPGARLRGSQERAR